MWRLLDSGYCEAAYNMALDEAIAVSVRRGGSPPTLRLYGWNIVSVSLGSFQKISDIDSDLCATRKIPVVRRPTGGRAILHGDELTYSFSAKNEGLFSKNLFETYHAISLAFATALEGSGVAVAMRLEKESGAVLTKSPVCFESTSYGEVSCRGKKLIGSAQKRWDDGFLQQGSIPYSIDYEMQRAVFKQKNKSDSHMIAIKEIHDDWDNDRFKQAVKTAFEKTFRCTLHNETPSPDEEALAAELVSKKYGNLSWTLGEKPLKTVLF
ncbi:MAG: lipoate--protein ligase family protein [Nitrospirae bacterium]|nr:MAG: lipoate--protein ligase family protein [Nitrospirota bacterium]